MAIWLMWGGLFYKLSTNKTVFHQISTNFKELKYTVSLQGAGKASFLRNIFVWKCKLFTINRLRVEKSRCIRWILNTVRKIISTSAAMFKTVSKDPAAVINRLSTATNPHSGWDYQTFCMLAICWAVLQKESLGLHKFLLILLINKMAA